MIKMYWIDELNFRLEYPDSWPLTLIQDRSRPLLFLESHWVSDDLNISPLDPWYRLFNNFFGSFKISVIWFGVPSYDFPEIKIYSKKNTKICHKVWNFSLLRVSLIDSFVLYFSASAHVITVKHTEIPRVSWVLCLGNIIIDYISNNSGAIWKLIKFNFITYIC